MGYFGWGGWGMIFLAAALFSVGLRQEKRSYKLAGIFVFFVWILLAIISAKN